MRRPRAPATALLALVLGLACGPGDTTERVPPAPTPAPLLDLEGIRQRGSLRLLLVRGDGGLLPRAGWPPDREREHAARFARELGIDTEWVAVERYEELIPALLDGRGDLIADNLTVTPARRRRVAFSAPYAYSREQIVTRADDTVSRPADLAGRRVAARPSSSFWESLELLRRDHPGIALEAVPEDHSTDDVLEGVARREYDVAIADSNLVSQLLAYRDDLRVAFDLGRDVVIAWAMRPGATRLRRAVDAFLTRVGAASADGALHAEDLPGIATRGVLRVLMRNGPSSYYVWRGQLLGFEYELARAFAERHELRLEVVVPPGRDDLFRWLREGRGDLIAAGLPIETDREGVVFSRLYQRVTPKLVARADDPIAHVDDLAGRRVALRENGPAWRWLTARRDEGLDVALEPVSDGVGVGALLDALEAESLDLVVADGHVVDVELTWRDALHAPLAIGEPVEHGWAMRAADRRLMAAVNAFLRAEYRGTFYNVLARRYFREPRHVRRGAEERAIRAGRLSPWDEQVQALASRYGFDWRLIVAQMHQESGFDPRARSFAGARGLLQVLPATARQVGVSDLSDPEAGLIAGVRYLAWLRERFDPELPPDERTWFALAAYNAGYGHVRDGRVLARARGWDPNRWFGQVERAMLLLTRPEIAEHARFGYCRCGETVRYVREVRDRYRAYVQAVGESPPPGEAAATQRPARGSVILAGHPFR